MCNKLKRCLQVRIKVNRKVCQQPANQLNSLIKLQCSHGRTRCVGNGVIYLSENEMYNEVREDVNYSPVNTIRIKCDKIVCQKEPRDKSTCTNDWTNTTNFKCSLLLENRGQEIETFSHCGTGFIHTVLKMAHSFISRVQCSAQLQ